MIHKLCSLFEWIVIELQARFAYRDHTTGTRIQTLPLTEQIGSRYGGWLIPTGLIDEESVCYCVGVGEDITFDLGIIDRFGCNVFAFDPMPRAKAHVRDHASDVPEFQYFEFGLWDKEDTVKLYAHSNPASTSYSITNLHNTDTFFEAQVKRLSDIMSELGHERIDVLKIDIEGAEYKVVDSIIADQLDIGVICIEYDELHSKNHVGYRERIADSVAKLEAYGYTLTALKPKSDYTFVRNDLHAEVLASA